MLVEARSGKGLFIPAHQHWLTFRLRRPGRSQPSLLPLPDYLTANNAAEDRKQVRIFLDHLGRTRKLSLEQLHA
jgi:hypothetical protein